ncbi:MAG: L-serine ammonia-lyase, iron-sulfur-dependent subunit beta [Clostridium perfringens]|nr:L-serine ammonia-lyase, iron-sulfur-dependent subunit beta [Clostridium perfringens]
MQNFGVFDIIGPIMIGPSSSHTAGAARLGKVAKSICGHSKLKKVTFLLHGSFGKTYKGHGTDKALVAGILGMEPSDERLRNSLELAKKEGIEIEFKETDLGDEHPNTVKFLMTTVDNAHCEVMGSSIGGGNIKITEVNGNSLDFSGEYPTLIISHQDVPGVVCKVSEIVYKYNVNIAFMKVFRIEKGKSAVMIFELDNSLDEHIVEDIKKVDYVNKIIVINPVEGGIS